MGVAFTLLGGLWGWVAGGVDVVEAGFLITLFTIFYL